ncbi:MAG: prolyl oligopeptidase family serine peptidase, partial [Deltaproteobacteria bacterium]
MAVIDAASIVPFRDRRIDLEAHLEAFPYVRFRASAEARQLLYFRETREARELWTLPITDGAMALERGVRLGDADWSRRGLREMRYRAAGREYVVLADDANEERYNLFALPIEPGAPMRRLTDRPYVYGFRLDRAGRQVAYVARYGPGQPYHSCLNVIDMEARADREVVCDTPEVSFTWTRAVFTPDGGTMVISALRASDRNHENLVAVDLREASPSVRLLTDPGRRRRNVDVERDWLDDARFLFTSDEDGFTNVYVYDIAARTARAITHFTEDVTDIAPFTVGARTVVGAIVRRPYESELFVVDPSDGEVLARRVFDATSTFLDHAGDHAMIESESRRTRFQLDEVRVALPEPARAEIVVSPRAGVPPDVAARIERCQVERVQIPTFDIDPHTGRTRMLHAFVQTPRSMPARLEQRVAFIEGFYGGENHWDTSAQILCDAGAIVVSPSVRGSAGFGAEFAALNDHDLGGNEVIDLMYVARDIARRFQLQPWQIGLFGGSHGGYEVLRAMTFPRGVNGRDEQFAWGFGVSWFGFSNIVSFYEH